MFRRLREKFHDDWCTQCTAQMDVVKKQLFALPTMTVGHYVSHREAAYLIEHLVPVEKKAEIPTGMYACGLIGYRCPECGHRSVKAQVFLPVRDMEKTEEYILFDHGEVDWLLWGQMD